jgi:tRNA A37 methylthiotransferase MiaB
MKLASSFTSTGEKLFHHQAAMQALRDGKGLPIHAWLAAHDLCNHKCAFCSVGERAGDNLPFPAAAIRSSIGARKPERISMTWLISFSPSIWKSA